MPKKFPYRPAATEEGRPTNDRRSGTTLTGQMVIRSFEAMGRKGRMRMRIGGGILMMLGAIPPAIAGAFERDLAGSYLVFEGAIFLAGLLLFWPDAFVLFVKMIPGAVIAVAKVMPNRILSLFERRNQIEKPKDEE